MEILPGLWRVTGFAVRTNDDLEENLIKFKEYNLQ